MNAAVMRQAFEVFDRVREAPASDREWLLESDESLSDEIRVAVRDLLRHDSPTGEFLGVSVGAAAASLAEPLRDAALPKRIGRYCVLREIGRGGFGRVYLAEQDAPRRQVAVKVLRAGFSKTDARRLIFEAEALARLDHPGIARVYESGTCDDIDESPYIAMEYIEGASLDRFAMEHQCSRSDRIRILELVAEALAHAHQRGVLHRDLSPKNIIVDGKRHPRLIDFGLAHTLVPDALSRRMTLTGSLLGTLRYMSPEQLGGDTRAIDTRSDVFSLGVIAFELLCGSHPYVSDEANLGRAIRCQLETAPRRPGSLDPTLRGDAEAVLLRCVERASERRYPSASSLAEDLRALRLGEPVSARAYSTLSRLRMFCSRHRVGVGVAAAVAALLTVSGASMAVSLRRESVAQNAAVNALDAIVTHVITPLSPRVGTLEERERLLDAIEPDIALMSQRSPRDPRVARITGAYLGAVGDVLKEHSRHGEAVKTFGRSLTAYEQAMALGDASLPTAHAFSIVCVKQGDSFASLNDYGHSQASYERALLLDAELASRHPNDLRVLSNLFWSHWRIAGWPLSEMHGTKARDAEAVAARMRAIAPDDWRTLEAITRVNTRWSIELGVAGDSRESLRVAQEGLAAARALLATDPNSGVFLKALIQAACCAASASLDTGEVAEARVFINEASRAAAVVEPTIQDPAGALFFVSILDETLARLALEDGQPAVALRRANSRLAAFDRFYPIEALSADLALGRLRMLEIRAIAKGASGARNETLAANEEVLAEVAVFESSIQCSAVTRRAAGQFRLRAAERMRRLNDR
ncbi:MAG: serine/threonine protein kinase [Phycisphaerales bacterium]|nr:serine/threonine protein kinase [Phycisphaerales bacterium]